jgi:hypothetical protein
MVPDAHRRGIRNHAGSFDPPRAKDTARRFLRTNARARYQAVGTVPPSMTYSVPVMEAARGDARNATKSATSPGLAGRPSGMPPSESMTIFRPPS